MGRSALRTRVADEYRLHRGSAARAYNWNRLKQWHAAKTRYEKRAAAYAAMVGIAAILL